MEGRKGRKERKERKEEKKKKSFFFLDKIKATCFFAQLFHFLTSCIKGKSQETTLVIGIVLSLTLIIKSLRK